MPICVNIAKVLNEHNLTVNSVSAAVGRTNVNVSRIKTGRVVSIRFSTLDRLIEAIIELSGNENCSIEDIIEYVPLHKLTKAHVVCYPEELRDPIRRMEAVEKAKRDMELRGRIDHPACRATPCSVS